MGKEGSPSPKGNDIREAIREFKAGIAEQSPQGDSVMLGGGNDVAVIVIPCGRKKGAVSRRGSLGVVQLHGENPAL
jgi:hypothetical protein